MHHTVENSDDNATVDFHVAPAQLVAHTERSFPYPQVKLEGTAALRLRGC